MTRIFHKNCPTSKFDILCSNVCGIAGLAIFFCGGCGIDGQSRTKCAGSGIEKLDNWKNMRDREFLCGIDHFLVGECGIYYPNTPPPPGRQKLVSSAEFMVDIKHVIRNFKRSTVFEIFTFLWDLVFLGHQ
jgi:hypothetical protein